MPRERTRAPMSRRVKGWHVVRDGQRLGMFRWGGFGWTPVANAALLFGSLTQARTAAAYHGAKVMRVIGTGRKKVRRGDW